MAPPNPTIVVPGITATYLKDHYPLPPEKMWTVLTKEFERIALHPDDLRYEAIEPARVVPDQLYEIAYKELVEELRFNLREKESQPVPVFPFGYDWRQPLEITEKELARFIEEVISRTLLLKHYAKSEYANDPKVNLVGHSMGGLIIAGYLASEKKKAPVGKVVTLAAPFQGSFEAVIKVITGTADLGTKAPSSRERRAARLTPALYHLIPSFKNGLLPESLPDGALFDHANWQKSVIDTIADYIRNRGLPGEAPTKRALNLFDGMLKQAYAHRKRVSNFNLSDAGLTQDDWLAVIGVNAKTRVRLTLKKAGQRMHFDLKSADRDNRWGHADPAVARMTGDGTVPFEGAVPPFIDY
ncbi:MAG: alpha/beta fold hydrolase, partial [Deltaproteobacteria bacterium]|nr:alpha/beta fold hydrolase [Deltaproteobacteria bacterium]